MSNPFVSILVPVYNSEPYLRSFLESAVLQTLENIEIIAINNCSTDNSLEILMEFQTKYPDKIFVYNATRHYDFVGVGRNLALQHAKGDYVYFCDSDDMIQYGAMEVLYHEAIKYDSDLVCGYALMVIEDAEHNFYVKKSGYKETISVNNETAICSGAEFWMRLVKRSLIEYVGKMPEDVIFDDVAYLPVLHSYAKNIRFINYPVYYYFRRETSTAGTPSLEVACNSVKAGKYALENCNPIYQKAVEKMVAGRILANLDLRWKFSDIFIRELKELWPKFNNNELITVDKNLYKRLKTYADLSNDSLPNTVYVDGFSGNLSSNFLDMIQEKAFNEGCSIYILNEKNCDISENKVIQKAYHLKMYDYVGKYFAVKRIYENGGVFISNKINLINGFNFLKYHRGFFSYIDQQNFSEEVFGAVAGNLAYERILDTYQWNWNTTEFLPLAERIKMILTVEFDISLNGRSRLYREPISLLEPSLLIVDTRFGNNNIKAICEQDFSGFAHQSQYITLKRSTLKTLMAEKSPHHINNAAQAELEQIKSSNTWRVVQKLRNLGDSRIGPYIKIIFRLLLKLYKWFKR